MCRMFGVASKETAPASVLGDFANLAMTGKVKQSMTDCHQDGWGIAGYLGGRATYFGRSSKGAVADAENFERASNKALNSGSKIIVAHIRKASEGEIKVENSHPFILGDWIFCHNGNVFDSSKLVILSCTYEGSTDSERMFKFLVSKLEHRGPRYYREALFAAIKELKEKCRYTSLTFLLSSGEYLIGYRDFSEEEDYYTLFYAYAHNCIMFCSEQLPGREWIEMNNRELIMITKTGDFIETYW